MKLNKKHKSLEKVIIVFILMALSIWNCTIPGEKGDGSANGSGTEIGDDTGTDTGDGNIKPIANAGNDANTPLNIVFQLDGSGSSGLPPLSYAWTLNNDGCGAGSLSNPTTKNPSFTPTVEGQCTISLVVTNGTGSFSTSDSITITATVPPIPAITWVNKTDGSAITSSQSIQIRFNKSMNTSTLSLGGTMSSETDSGAWTSTTYSNDTVTLNPIGNWSKGSGKTLTVDAQDFTGNNLISPYSLTYHILDSVIYVKTTGNDTYPGTQTQPKKTIQNAIDSADELFTTAEVHVAEGTYWQSGTISLLIQSSAGLIIKSGISIYGGYSSTDWNNRNPSTYITNIKDSSTTDGYFANPNRAIHVGFGVSSATIIDGFTITGGGGDNSSAITYDEGHATISNNVINGGSGSSNAYGIYNTGSASPVISNNVINGGSGGVYTRGILSDYASPTITGNDINGGAGSTGSWGIDDYYSSSTITKNKIYGGSSPSGTGIKLTGSSTFIANNTINGGSSSSQTTYGIYMGAALSTNYPVIVNNTINGGEGFAASIGIEITISTPIIDNNIIFTTGGDLRYCVYESGSEASPSSFNNNNIYDCPTANYLDTPNPNTFTQICAGGNPGDSDCSNVLSTPTGSGNVSADLAFVNLVGEDWHLTASTPATITQGGFNHSGLITTDKDGVARTVPWSMGAYEFD